MPNPQSPPSGHPYRFTTIAHGDMSILGPLLPAELDGLVATAVAALPIGGAKPPFALDIGCGKGDLLVRFALRGVRGIGVDRNPWFIADAERLAAAAGVAGNLEWRTADAAVEPLVIGADIAACIGATGALGGPVTAPGVVAHLLRPGGIGLIGEAFWREPPPAGTAEAFGMGPDEMVDLDATVARVAAGGLVPLAVVRASLAGWDAYEDAYAGAVERWADGHPDDPDREAFTEGAAMMRATWTAWRRASMGFAVIVVRRAAG